MKKLLLLAALIGSAFFAKAQSSDYKAFKFDIGFGYAIPTSSTAPGGSTKAGVTFTLQPHYRVSDALAIGVRIEGAGLGYEDESSGNTDIHVQVLYSYCATAEYYFLKGGFRPFVGGGAGFFNQSSTTINSDDENNNTNNVDLIPGGTKFGFFPEAGFEAGKFRMSAAYNVLGKDTFGNNNSYASFNIGFFFGGGRKR